MHDALRSVAARFVALSAAGTCLFTAPALIRTEPELRVWIVEARRLPEDELAAQPELELDVHVEGGAWGPHATFRCGTLTREVHTARGWQPLRGRCGQPPWSLLFCGRPSSERVPYSARKMRFVVEFRHTGWFGRWHEVERAESAPFRPSELLAGSP